MSHHIVVNPASLTSARAPILALCVALALPCMQAHAQDPGMVVVRDPVTGDMRAPTPAELRALRALPPQGAAQQPPQQTQSVLRPDGSRSVKLGENSMVYSVARRDAGGKLKEECVHGIEAAERAVDGAAPQPGKENHHEHR